MVFNVSAQLDPNHPVDAQIYRAMKWCDHFLEPFQWFRGSVSVSDLRTALAILENTNNQYFPFGPDNAPVDRAAILQLMVRLQDHLIVIERQHSMPDSVRWTYAILER